MSYFGFLIDYRRTCRIYRSFLPYSVSTDIMLLRSRFLYKTVLYNIILEITAFSSCNKLVFCWRELSSHKINFLSLLNRSNFLRHFLEQNIRKFLMRIVFQCLLFNLFGQLFCCWESTDVWLFSWDRRYNDCGEIWVFSCLVFARWIFRMET
jgi:hypothetical protein